MNARVITIRFLDSITSSEGWAYGAGQVVELPETVARAFLAGGIAEPVEVPATDPVRVVKTRGGKRVETAAVQAPETRA